MTDLLRVVDVDIDCLIGIHPEERTTPQPLRVSLAFAVDTRRAALEDNLDLSVDYARVVGEVGFVLRHGHFHLIETAAEVACRVVLSGIDLDEMELTLEKPRALGGNGRPTLTVRRAKEAASSRWTFGFGVVDVVWNVLPTAAAAHGHGPSRALGLYRLQLRGAHAVQLPREVVAFACDEGRQGEPLPPTARLVNGSSDVRTFLLLSRPPLRLDEFVGVAVDVDALSH